MILDAKLKGRAIQLWLYPESMDFNFQLNHPGGKVPLMEFQKKDSRASLENIEVKAYSGFKGNERPVSFIVMGLEKKVLNILDRWLGPDKDYFKVVADDDMIYTLSWNRETDAWNIEKISVVLDEN